MIDRRRFIHDCGSIRTSVPLVLNITNYVAMNYCANALLAIGASPLMSFCPEEMEELASRCDSLVINIGCLDSQQIKAMRLASSVFGKMGKKWVLDPVGAGTSALRKETALSLVDEFHPSIIRCNASEITALSGSRISGRGVDSSLLPDDVSCIADEFAKKSGCVISVSGPVDYITDGSHSERISNGSPLMPRVTATGCVASAITGAVAAVEKSSFDAALNAMAIMGVAGEIAASRSEGTGSFQVRFLDELSNFDAEKAAELIRQ